MKYTKVYWACAGQDIIVEAPGGSATYGTFLQAVATDVVPQMISFEVAQGTSVRTSSGGTINGGEKSVWYASDYGDVWSGTGLEYQDNTGHANQNSQLQVSWLIVGILSVILIVRLMDFFPGKS